MKITLRKANAIQTAISEVISSLDLTTQISVTEFERPNEKLEAAKKQFFDNVETRSNLLDALYEIRASVSGANSSNGVNGLLVILAQNEKDISLYSKLAQTPVQIKREVMIGKIGKMRERKEDSYRYGGEDVVTTSIFSDADIQEFKSDLASLKKEKQKLKDELLELNVRTEINLSDTVTNTLKAANIL